MHCNSAEEILGLGFLTHPRIKWVDVSGSSVSPDNLATTLVAGAGTLKLLNLTGCGLSPVLEKRAGLLSHAVFHLSRVSEFQKQNWF